LNLEADQEIRPANGVYAAETVIDGETHCSVTNVGVRPTFNGSGVTVESHLLDFEGAISPSRMEIRFLKHLREERRFDGPLALRAQIALDIVAAKSFFRKSISSHTLSIVRLSREQKRV
jgi:riboflavin kinase/FMN adenylyltransferase